MKQPLQLNQQQQRQYNERFNAELEKMTMSWDNELYAWHPVAIKALRFANIRSLQCPQNKLGELFKTELHGLGMNVVASLCNNLEDRSAFEMDMTTEEWAGWLVKNHEIGKRWTEMIIPVQKRVNKEFEIMNGKDAGMRIIAKA